MKEYPNTQEPIHVLNEENANIQSEVNKGVNNYVPPPSQTYLLIKDICLYVSNLHIRLFQNALDILFHVPCDWIAKFKQQFDKYNLHTRDITIFEIVQHDIES